jgi:predicted small lipoprotein YifL
MTTYFGRALATAFLLALLLSACGTKGPLYLPEPPAPAADEPTED